MQPVCYSLNPNHKHLTTRCSPCSCFSICLYPQSASHGKRRTLRSEKAGHSSNPDLTGSVATRVVVASCSSLDLLLPQQFCPDAASLADSNSVPASGILSSNPQHTSKGRVQKTWPDKKWDSLFQRNIDEWPPERLELLPSKKLVQCAQLSLPDGEWHLLLYL